MPDNPSSTDNLDEIAALRRFTRFFTRQAELLDEGLLGSRFTLPEVRLLYEIAHRDRPIASELSRDLGIDPAYVSRILKRFVADGLVARMAVAGDARQTMLAMTEQGRDAFAPLDQRSQDEWARRLEHLSPGHRHELAAAAGTIERLLGPAPAPADVALRRHQVGDIGWIARRQGLLYAAEYGFDVTFEALVAEILVAFVRDQDPDWERAWIAERAGRILGSVFLVRSSPEVAKLRLLYVEPEARGLGLGRRLVSDCVAFARERGYGTLTLWTNDCLHAARRIYQDQGFVLIEEERHHSFGQDLVGQNWSLAL